MTLKTWVASHTGLPSFYSDVPIRITAPDGRVLADGTKPVLLSDALAPPGVQTTYAVGDSTVQLARTKHDNGQTLITDINGRGIPGLTTSNNEDPLAWTSTAKKYDTGTTRWKLREEPISGETTVVLPDPTKEDALWNILRRRNYAIIGPTTPTPAVPLRIVVVNAITRTRIGANGETLFRIKWTQATQHQTRSAGSGAAPVVTWGEWVAQGQGWQHKTLLQLAQEIAGMP